MIRSGPVAALLGLALALVGCSGSVLGPSITPDPEVPHSADVRALAAAVRPTLLRLADQQVAGRRGLASGSQDGCHEGQNNWKVKDGYQWRCTRRILRVVEAGGVETGLRRQHRLLVDAGCWTEVRDGATFDVEFLLREYWQRYHPNGIDGRPYTAKDLPSLTYLCPDGLEVEITPSDRSEKYYLEYPPPWAGFADVDIELTWPSSVAERRDIARSRSPLHAWITVSTTYYQE